MSSNDNTFKWDPVSFGRKLASDSSITINGGPISATKNIGPNDPKRDAYRNCSNCGKHINFHNGGKCPK